MSLPTLDDIAAKVRICTACPLHQGRTNAVPGYGSPQAKILFIGEGPGEKEDKQGLPFVGAAGKYLDELLGSVGLKREDVFITNVVKCRPPGNRDPEPLEAETCTNLYLNDQVQNLKPKLIVTLGRHAMNYFLPNVKISDVHGKPKRYLGVNGQLQVYYPLYHPAAALYQGSLRATLLADFQKIPAVLKKVEELEARGELDSVSQPNVPEKPPEVSQQSLL